METGEQMDLQEKIKQRRKERQIEVTAEAANKHGLSVAELEAKIAFSKESEESRQRLIQDALNVISGRGAVDTTELTIARRAEAEKVLDSATNTAVEWYGGTMILIGFGLGMYIGFTNAWTLGILTAIGSIFLGAILNTILAKLKKAHMVQKHLANVSSQLGNSQEETKSSDT